MKRIALAIVSTITGLVMLLSFKTHAIGASPTATTVSSSTSSGKTTPSKGHQSTSAASPSKTITGSAVDTVYGPVQVRITTKGGKVVAATAVEYPQNDPRDAQINSYAIPILNAEAAKATNANIAHVSGATYTSEGYIASLQSALTQAGI
jgi:uncharacterized protein with FMN-binding domain